MQYTDMIVPTSTGPGAARHLKAALEALESTFRGEAEFDGVVVDHVHVYEAGHSLWVEVVGKDKYDQEVRFNPVLFGRPELAEFPHEPATFGST